MTENPLERIPPHDEAAEKSVLGAMIGDDKAAGVAVEMLIPEDFYLPRHQVLFKLFAELYQKQPDLDVVYLRSELERRGLTERVGGKEVFGQLLESVPTAANIERYCEIVRERASERRLLQAAGQIIRMCQQPEAGEDSRALVQRAEELVFKIADERASNAPVSIEKVLGEVLDEAERHVDARRKGVDLPTRAIATGFHDLDRLFAGGLWEGEVTVLAARPSVGKTTLGINIARKVACVPREKNPVPVAIFSMEMPKEQIAKNLLCSEAQVSSTKMRTYAFDEEDYETVKLAGRTLKNAPIFIDDTPGLTPGELWARARRLRHREHVRLLVIDYLQLMQAGGRHDNREQAVADLSRQVKQLARELKIPILLISQLRRPIQGQEAQRPNLSDLRESGAIEQDADVVVMLHREQDPETKLMKADTWAIVHKNRNGPIGDARLSFFPDQFRFEPFVPERQDVVSAVGT